MINFFKRKSNFEKEDKNRGIVTFTETEIVIQDTAFSREKERIAVDKIEYIYLETCHYSTAGLLIYQGRQHYIPVEYVNTEKLCLFLANRFSFDVQLIYQYVMNKEDAVHKLFRTTYTQNFEVLEERYTDYTEGFEILAPIPQWYAWSITKGELLASPYVTVEDNYVEINYPVRIGGVIVNELGAYIGNSRDEVAISGYSAKCYAIDGSDNSFYQLKDKITSDMGDTALCSYSNDGNLDFYVKIDNVSLSLSYSLDDNYMRSVAYSFSFFSINTSFDYPDLVVDVDYENKGEVSTVFTFAFELEMRSDYKSNPLIKKTPQCVLQATEAIAFVWKDEKNQLIGFGDREFAQWFECNSIASLTLWNTLPAKGGGFSLLSVELDDGKVYPLFEGAHDTMSTQKEELQKYLGVEVLFYEDYNC